MFEREIIITNDGSSSLYIPNMNETYHSKKGAIKESQFIYIDKGLAKLPLKNINIFEVGFGTGLNLVLSYIYNNQNDKIIYYETLEPFPLTNDEVKCLNYDKTFTSVWDKIKQTHLDTWDTIIEIDAKFKFKKLQQTIEEYNPIKKFDVIYFDAFAPSKQKKPWQIENLRKCYEMLNINGRLVTYCAQGEFKRNLKSLGFKVENPPGPMGKKEMTIAVKVECKKP